MTRLELLDKEEQLQGQLKDMISKAESENRKLHDGENEEFNKLSCELKEVRELLKNTDEFIKINEQENKQVIKMEKRTMDMSILTILRETRDKNQSEETRAIISKGKEEMRKAGIDLKSEIVLPGFESVEERAVNIGTDTAGGFAVEVNKTNILSPLLNELVLVKAGATVLTGLVGNVAIPSLGDITATFEGETAKTNDSTVTFSQVELSPKRISVVLPISNTWLEQDSVGAEEAIRRLIIDKVKEKIEQVALGAAAETAGKIPAGLLNGAVAKGALTYAGVVDMEGELLEKNVQPGCYIMHPKLMVKAKTVAKDAGSGQFVYQNGMMNGYPAYATNSVAKGLATGANEYGILLGDFSNFYMCFWNGLGIQTDPYTLAGENITRLIVNFYVDFKTTRDGSIYAASMK